MIETLDKDGDYAQKIKVVTGGKNGDFQEQEISGDIELTGRTEDMSVKLQGVSRRGRTRPLSMLAKQRHQIILVT